MTKRIAIFDGNPLCYRSIQTLADMQTTGGVDTGVILGTLNSMRRELAMLKPVDFAVCWDEGKSRHRLALYPEYKGDRKEKEPTFNRESFYRQMDQAKEILDFLGVKQFRVQGVESDDLMGFLSDGLTQVGHEVVIVSDDGDLHQLVNNLCTCYAPIRKKWFKADDFAERYYDLDLPQWLDMRALVGKKNNVIGVPGIGEKTAAKLLHKYGNLEAILSGEHDEELKQSKRNAKILEHVEDIRLATQLVGIPKLNEADDFLTVDEQRAFLSSFQTGGLKLSLVREALQRYQLVLFLSRFEEFIQIFQSREELIVSHDFINFFSKDSPTVSAPEPESLFDYEHYRGSLWFDDNSLTDLQVLDRLIGDCAACPMREECHYPVWGEGFDDAKIMLVGRNPGATENREGKPFCGKSGIRLNRFLETVGIKREDCWVTNTCKCYSTKNRAPTKDEIKACRPFLLEEFRLLKPDLVLVFGREAIEAVTGRTGSVYQMTGDIMTGAPGCPKSTVILCNHPSSALRSGEGESNLKKCEHAVSSYLKNDIPI